MHEVRVDESDDGFRHLRLRLQRIAEPLLDIDGESEAPCHGEDDGCYGHDGQQRGISERRRHTEKVVGDERLGGEYDDLGSLDKSIFPPRQFLIVEEPHILFQEGDDVVKPFHVLRSSGVREFRSLGVQEFRHYLRRSGVQGFRYLFIGKILEVMPQLRQQFYNSIFMDSVADNLQGIKADYIVFLTKYMSHKMYYKVKSCAEFDGIPIIYYNGKSRDGLLSSLSSGIA